ncbi:hypothetical protein [Streptomyces sp. NPDC058373]|uniref:hypothetical protein n=1 Tax=Streptomyces sp. NPDC058373 TaxID=3346465 RepID=UPI0036494064
METAELVLKYVRALAWPFVALVLIWCLRRHLAGAVARLSRVDTPAGSLEFAHEAQVTQEVAAELDAEDAGLEVTDDVTEEAQSAPPREEIVEATEEPDPASDQRRREAVRDLAYAKGQLAKLLRAAQDTATPVERALVVSRGWHLVENAVKATWLATREDHAASESDVMDVSNAMKRLERVGISPTAVRLVRYLEHLHGRVARSLIEPNRNAAVQYVRNCHSLVRALTNFLEQSADREPPHPAA